MSRTARITGDQRGFTLAEVLVAIGVILVGLVALLAASPLAMTHVGEANRKSTATFLAQHRLEQIKNAQWTSGVDNLGGQNGFNATVAQWPDEPYNTITIPTGPGNANYPRFRRTVTITDCSVAPGGCGVAADPSLATLRQVTVTVFYVPLTQGIAPTVGEASVQVATLIARGP